MNKIFMVRLYNLFPNKLLFLTCPPYKFFENTVGKAEIVCKKQFPPVFSSHLENFLPFSSNSKLSPADSFHLEESKICCLEKG